VDLGVAPRELGPGGGEARVRLHRLGEEAGRAGQIRLLVAAAKVVIPPQVEVVGHGIAGAHVGQRLPLRRAQGEVEGTTHPLGDVGLHPEDLGQLDLVRLAPQLAVVRDRDEPGAHPHTARARRSAIEVHTSLEHVSRAQLRADLLQGPVALPVLLRAGAADDPKPAEAGEPAGELLGETVGEVSVGRVAEIPERQHHQHRLAGRRGRCHLVLTERALRGDHGADQERDR
jgi:hypothetical protein